MSNQESQYQKQNSQSGTQQTEKKDFKKPDQEQKAKMGNGNKDDKSGSSGSYNTGK